MSKAAKRERQRLNREARREIELAAEKRRKRLRTARNFLIVLAPIVVIFVILQITGGSDDSDEKPSAASSKPSFATVTTSKGDIVIELDPSEAPETVANFKTLANDGFFDGLTFHRASRTVGVIQTGDETTGEGKPTPSTIPDELPSKGPYQIGDVAMANAGPNTASSQFFIITGEPGTQLPADYSRFGKVVSGLEVAQQIEGLAPESGDGPPTEQVDLVSVKLSRSNPTATTTTAPAATTAPPG